MTIDPGGGRGVEDGDLALSHHCVTALHPSVCGEVWQCPAARKMASVANVRKIPSLRAVKMFEYQVTETPVHTGLKHRAIFFFSQI